MGVKASSHNKKTIAPQPRTRYIAAMKNVKTPTNAALIVAGGRGSRAGSGLPKQYRTLPGHDAPGQRGQTVLGASLRAFIAHPQISGVQVVIHKDDQELYLNAINSLESQDKLYEPVCGGAERQDSVLAGLEALQAHKPKQVLVHDAARPFVSAELIDRCLTALGSAYGAVPAIAVTDTLKRAEAGLITETVSRDGLWRAQTPQAFNFRALLAAHRAAPPGLTDDAAVAELAGIQLALVAGDPDNIKMTHEADFTPRIAVPRTGQGFDVHRFDDEGTAETVMLGGMLIPHNRRIIGHSDADLVLHAITDALYGSIADGDIGAHFPPSDASNKDRASVDFLRHAAERVTSAGCRIVHIDVTVICEAPKIGPHRTAMAQNIAGLLHLDEQVVSVKATTTEGLGFTGRGEGLAAQALATVVPLKVS